MIHLLGGLEKGEGKVMLVVKPLPSRDIREKIIFMCIGSMCPGIGSGGLQRWPLWEEVRAALCQTELAPAGGAPGAGADISCSLLKRPQWRNGKEREERGGAERNLCVTCTSPTPHPPLPLGVGRGVWSERVKLSLGKKRGRYYFIVWLFVSHFVNQ